MDIIGGTPAALTIPFVLGDLPVAPDVGSVSYTIRDNTGQPMTGLTNMAYMTTATSYQMQALVPSSAHTIAAGRRFERRSVLVKFTVNGAEVQLTRNYRIVPELQHSVSAKEVRAFIGIEDHELPDQDIDIFSAYLAVEKSVGESVLTISLTSGTAEELAANTMIRMRAVLNVLPSAKQRMAQSEKNGVKEFTRVDLKELDKLKLEAEARYQEAYDQIVITTETPVAYFLVSTNTDAITG